MASCVEHAGHKAQQRPFQILSKIEKLIHKRLHEWSWDNEERPLILNENNIDILNPLLNQFIDEVKVEIEAWSERGSGWIMDKILEAFINVAQYRSLRGGSYMVLPTKLKNKKAILNIQNRDNQCLRWGFELLYSPHQEVETRLGHRVIQQKTA